MTATPEAGTAEKIPDDDAGSADPWVQAAERIRSTATWITKAFVAVGAALVGSTPVLYRFGDLELSARTVVSGIAGVVALVAVGTVIFAASEVARPSVATMAALLSAPEGSPLGNLRVELEGSEAAQAVNLRGARSVADLLARREEHHQAAVLMDDLALNAPTAASKKVFEQLRDSNLDAITVYDDALRVLSERASYALLESRFMRARRTMLGAGGVLAVALAVWVGGLRIEVGEDKEDSTGAAAAEEGSGAGPGDLSLLVWHDDATADDDLVTVQALRTELGLDSADCDELDVLVTAGKGTTQDPWRLQLGYGTPQCNPGAVIQVDGRFASLSVPAPPRKVVVEGIPPEETTDDGAAAVVALSALGLAILGGLIWRRSRA